MVIKAVGQLLQAGRFREDEFPATGHSQIVARIRLCFGESQDFRPITMITYTISGYCIYSRVASFFNELTGLVTI